MADIFLNLTTQSLSSSIEIQPLIAPLFAPAPQLVSVATLSPFDGLSPVTAETLPSSMLSQDDDEMADTWEMESHSQKSMPAIRRSELPNLVPSDVPEQAISTVSIRHLLHTQHTADENVELIMPDSQLSVVAPAAVPDEASIEDKDNFSLSEDTSGDAEVSRPASVQRPLSTPAQETYSSQATVKHEERIVLPSRPLPNDQSASPTFPAIQPLFPASAASLQSPQLPSQPEPTTKTDVPQQSLFPMPMQQPPIAPNQHSEVPFQSIDRARTSADQPLPHQIEKDEQRKNVMGRQFVDESEPIVQPAVTPDAAVMTPTSVSSKALSVQNVLPVIARQDKQTTQVTDVNKRSDKPGASTPPVETAERNFMSVAPSPSEDLQSLKVLTMQEERVGEEELEISPVRVTIGRVVVRATPATLATPAVPPVRKRVPHPAQSLSEYLKQRERGSR